MKKAKKKTNKKTIKSNYVLLIIFILLIILVFFLGVKIYDLSKKDTSPEAEIVIPILEKDNLENLNINLSSLEKDQEQEYVFKITNFRNNKINTSKINYNLNFSSNNDNVTLKLYRNDEENNLLTDNSYSVKNTTLKANSEDVDLYKLVIKANEKIETVKINITIES